MNGWGKIIGLLLGAYLAGFWGALLGLWFGHQVDVLLGYPAASQRYSGFERHGESQAKRIFFEVTFAVMGFLAKADGRVSERSINVARQIMIQMALNKRQQRQAMLFFNQGKQPNFNLDAALVTLLRAAQLHPSLLQQFVELQLKIVYSCDYQLSLNKRRLLEYISQRLGFVWFEGSSQQEKMYTASNDDLTVAYSLLNVPITATDQEVKMAYRRLMSRYHPDKLASRGETFQLKQATEKTQQIKAAYEQIRLARAMR